MIALSVVLSLVSFGISGFLEPVSRFSARQMVAVAYADLLSSVIEEKTFRSIENGLYVQISERHSGRLLKGLFVVDYRDPNFDLIYYAREGSVDPGGTSLTMRDGEVHRKSVDGRISIVKFVSYAFDLSAMAKSDDEGGLPLYAGDRSLGFLLNPDPTDSVYQRQPEKFRAELHRRLSEWLYPLTFALVSLLVAGSTRSHRQTRVHPMVFALTFAFALRWLGFSVSNLTERSAAYVPAVYAVPIVTSAIVIFMLATNRQVHMPKVISRGIGRISGLLTQRLAGRRQSGGGAA